MSGSAEPITCAGAPLGSYRHVCGFFDGAEDEYRATLPFVEEGLNRKEGAFHFVDPANRASYAQRLEQGGIRVAEVEKSGQFQLHTWPETSLSDGQFDPDAMLKLVEEVLQRNQRFPLVRIVGHTNFPDASRKTWDDWISYEARLNRVLSRQPGAVVCAYEISKCSGRQVMDLLRTHPVVIIGGVARSNPFFAPPDEFLAALRDRVASRAEPASDPADPEQSFDPSEQMRDLERLLAILGHDLRNPLGAVMMGALVLEHEPGIPSEVLRTASRILVSAKRMSRIIEDLLEFCSARMSVGTEMKLEPTDAHELCRRIVDELQLGHPGREMRLRPEGNGSGRWDADRLEQVVSNLVANALQYGPEDAPVTIDSRGSETEWTLSVHNLGAPILPEVLRTLFEPFRRGRDASTGGIPHLGIGLFIVRRIVQAHRGTVDVSSGADGTRFVVRLPKS